LKKFDGGLTYKSDQKARCLVASPEMIDREKPFSILKVFGIKENQWSLSFLNEQWHKLSFDPKSKDFIISEA